MTTFTAAPATDEAFILGEGPVWDPDGRRLLWVDVLGEALLEGRLEGERITVTARHEFGEMVSVVAPAAGGGLVVGVQERLVRLSDDGTRTPGPRLLAAGGGRRLNDGATDPAGRFLVGTMCLAVESETEELMRLESDGRVTILDGDLGLHNGPAWSRDGSRMYSADTLRHHVWMRGYDPATGETGPRTRFADLDPGMPDGMAVDGDDHLWVAVFNGREIRRYDPEGALVARVAVPAARVTSLAFAGEELDRMVITTGNMNMSDAERAELPDSGRLFVADVGVGGLPVVPWAGTASGAG
jgi:sugar lactone lactonase YvrE